MIRCMALILLLLCTACIQFGSDPQPVDYYLLQEANNPDCPETAAGPTVYLKLVAFPGYLDRKELVVHSEDGKIDVAKNAFWAEPLQDNLLRVLRRNLSACLPYAQISISPWEKKQPRTLTVELLINEFSGKLSEVATVDIDCALSQDGQPIRSGHFTQEQIIGDNYLDLVKGLSFGLEQYSKALADKLVEADADSP